MVFNDLNSIPDASAMAFTFNWLQRPDWLRAWDRSPDVEAVHRRALANGLEITYAPVDMPWGVRECHVRHPDEHVFRLTRTRPG